MQKAPNSTAHHMDRPHGNRPDESALNCIRAGPGFRAAKANRTATPRASRAQTLRPASLRCQSVASQRHSSYFSIRGTPASKTAADAFCPLMLLLRNNRTDFHCRPEEVPIDQSGAVDGKPASRTTRWLRGWCVNAGSQASRPQIRAPLERVMIFEQGHRLERRDLRQPVASRQGDDRHKLERPSLLRL